MNPGEVAQQVLPLTSSDLSLFALFWQAHWLVKAVMLGLLLSSVWVWAIVIDKMLLYTRTRRAMDVFEQTFWSGQASFLASRDVYWHGPGPPSSPGPGPEGGVGGARAVGARPLPFVPCSCPDIATPRARERTGDADRRRTAPQVLTSVADAQWPQLNDY